MSDILVFISRNESTCGECGEELGRHAWITLQGDKGAVCLSCADLDHLVFLPPGNAALTRRTRKRYERQGLLVEEEGLATAEAECLADQDARAAARARAAVRRQELDERYVASFAQRVRELFPRCPLGRETTIAEHACIKYSSRVGRSAAANALDGQAVRLAGIAHVRHAETNHDDLLAQGWDRHEAREAVRLQVDQLLEEWEGGDKWNIAR